MTDKGDHWNGFKNNQHDTAHQDRINQVLQTADFDFLCSAATRLRHKLEPTHQASPSSVGPFSCSTDTTRFATGQENVVFKVQFSDSVSWVARVRLLEKEGTENAAIETSMLSELATMKLVYERTTIPLPRVYGFDVAADNRFGFRYVLMQRLSGHHLDSGLARCVPSERFDQVADRFADIYFQLSRLRFDSIGQLWMGRQLDQEPHIIPADGTRRFHTSLEYFYSLRRQQGKAIQADHPDDEQWATASWILERALPAMVVEDHLYGPFPLGHIDLHHGNILVDDNFNITGIIDWSKAQTVPLERFTISPEFATFPGLSAEKNAPILRLREKFAARLRVRELAALQPPQQTISDDPERVRKGEEQATLALISDMMNTSLWEIVYRCIYTFHWRALTDARLVMGQIYGSTAKWDDFVTFYQKGSTNQLSAHR